MDILQTYISAHPEQIGFWGIVIYMIFKDAVLPIGRFFGRLFTAQSESTQKAIAAHQKEAEGNNEVMLELISVQKDFAATFKNIEKLLARDSAMIEDIHKHTGETHADVRALPKALDNRFKTIIDNQRTTDGNLKILNSNLQKIYAQVQKPK